jgi:hypothetical protein
VHTEAEQVSRPVRRFARPALRVAAGV